MKLNIINFGVSWVESVPSLHGVVLELPGPLDICSLSSMFESLSACCRRLLARVSMNLSKII